MSDFDLSSINSVSDVFPRPKRKAVRKKRLKPRNRKTVVRLDAKGMKALREERYEIDSGRCVVCGHRRPLDGGLRDRMHLAHIVSRGAGGSDTLENTVCKCYGCHIEVEHGLKWKGSKRI
jgi:5-methylcytosine-specific restriction endonuclease McrA